MLIIHFFGKYRSNLLDQKAKLLQLNIHQTDSHDLTLTCLLISENLPTFDCSCMFGNTELFLFWSLEVQNNFMYPTMQEQSKVSKCSEIKKQFCAKSWLTYPSLLLISKVNELEAQCVELEFRLQFCVHGSICHEIYI